MVLNRGAANPEKSIAIPVGVPLTDQMSSSITPQKLIQFCHGGANYIYLIFDRVPHGKRAMGAARSERLRTIIPWSGKFLTQ